MHATALERIPYTSRFDQMLSEHNLELTRQPTTILQINLGKMCNQTCQHCHVDAGPTRKEIMTRETIDRLIALAAEAPQISTVDLTGGAPEMNPHFAYIVEAMRELGKGVIVRCNLTILLEPGYEWAAPLFARQQVHVVSSLPCYTPARVNKQRGKGVFDKSIQALQWLNRLGYAAKEHPELQLDLVYNPLGPTLPPDQASLEADYKREMQTHFGIAFNNLLTITNLPVGRFERTLRRRQEYIPYLNLLVQAFNPAAAAHVMCRSTLNVGWDGKIYDCDFNQMLEIPLAEGALSLFDAEFSFASLLQAPIITDDHCLGCTAGAGSSCGGALT